ncbi:MAG: hypothetical protein Q9209_001782 [Squamulea sp. 1 TL-2023]
MAGFTTPQKSSSTSKTTSSISHQAGFVREILALKGFPIDDIAARETFLQGINEAKDLLTEPRHSAPSKQLLHQIDQTRVDYADRNETTFTNKFFSVFQSKSRSVSQAIYEGRNQRDRYQEDGGSKDSSKVAGDIQVPEGWAARDWIDDGLDENDNRVFQAGSVPRISPVEDGQTAILNDLPRISNPQPDIIYGTSIKKHYTLEERAVIARFKNITQISLGLACPFFDVEVKTKGDIEEATNQACSGGAGMVEGCRALEILARSGAPPKAKIKTSANPTADVGSEADFSTRAYTMVLTPQLAKINVHWAEVCSDGIVTYYMHCIKSYALSELDQLKSCRAAVNNILDWGLGERDKKIKTLLKQVHDRYKAIKAVKAKGKGKGKDKCLSVDKTPEKKKRRVDEGDDDNDDLEIWQSMHISDSEE